MLRGGAAARPTPAREGDGLDPASPGRGVRTSGRAPLGPWGPRAGPPPHVAGPTLHVALEDACSGDALAALGASSGSSSNSRTDSSGRSRDRGMTAEGRPAGLGLALAAGDFKPAQAPPRPRPLSRRPHPGQVLRPESRGHSVLLSSVPSSRGRRVPPVTRGCGSGTGGSPEAGAGDASSSLPGGAGVTLGPAHPPRPG